MWDGSTGGRGGAAEVGGPGHGGGASTRHGLWGQLALGAVFLAITLNMWTGWWDNLVESSFPVLFVAAGVAIAMVSLANGASIGGGGAAPGSAALSSQQLAPARGTGTRSTVGRQQGGGGPSAGISSSSGCSGGGGWLTPADMPDRPSASASVVSARPASTSTALAERTCSLSCPKPRGCGFRHVSPDTGSTRMRCDRHGSHPLPPDGSVWRDVVPAGQPGAGQLRLVLSWEGAAWDVTELGRCRQWDRELTAKVGELIGSGTRVSGMCSQSQHYPRLSKAFEVAGMDYRAAARGRRLWTDFLRWRRHGQQQAGGRPLAIEMGRRGG